MAEHGSSMSRADTRVFLAAHETFRLTTNRLTVATEQLKPSALAQIIRSRWSFYSTVLHHHHHVEDESVFPALVAVRPDLGALINRLEEEHQQLLPAMEAVDTAIVAFEQRPDPAEQQTLHQAVVAVRDLFFPHLDLEDAQILPAITESLPADQWRRLDDAALKSIPREYLPIAVGALDEVIRSSRADERPPPPPLPIRLMLALSWRKKWSAWVRPLLV